MNKVIQFKHLKKEFGHLPVIVKSPKAYERQKQRERTQLVR